MAEADLSLVMRLQERLVDEVAALRDDMRVVTAIVMRIDGSLGALTAEFRATHAQMQRMNDRLRKLEETGP